jgi:hypothetical protein
MKTITLFNKETTATVYGVGVDFNEFEISLRPIKVSQSYEGRYTKFEFRFSMNFSGIITRIEFNFFGKEKRNRDVSSTFVENDFINLEYEIQNEN